MRQVAPRVRDVHARVHTNHDGNALVETAANTGGDGANGSGSSGGNIAIIAVVICRCCWRRCC